MTEKEKPSVTYKTLFIAWHCEDQPEPVLSIDFHPSLNKIATSGQDCTIKLWNIKDEEIEFRSTLKHQEKTVNCVRWHPNGKILASGNDGGNIFLWQESENNSSFVEETNKESWLVFKNFKGHSEDVYDLQWSKDGNYLISASIDNSIILWNMSGKIQQYTEHSHYVQGVVFDPLSMFFVSQSGDKTCRIYSMKTQKCASIIREKFKDENVASFFKRISISPDGNLLVTSAGLDKNGGNCCYIYQRNNWEEPIFTLPGFKDPVIGSSFSPFYYELRTDEDHLMKKFEYRMLFCLITLTSLIVYDTQRLYPIFVIENLHLAPLTDVTWANDGNSIWISSMDGYCSLISLSNIEFMFPFKNNKILDWNNISQIIQREVQFIQNLINSIRFKHKIYEWRIVLGYLPEKSFKSLGTFFVQLNDRMKKVALITGGSKGIGYSLAKKLALEENFSLVINSRTEKELKKVNDEIIQKGGISDYFVGDITIEKNCENLVNFTIEKFGKIDVLVHNAALIDIKKIENLTSIELLKTFQANIISPIILTQLALKHLRKTKGKVIFISSGAAFKPIFGWSSYCTTKAALHQFMQCLAVEEPEINSISFRPGRVDTDMMSRIRNEGQTEMNSKDYQGFLEAKEKDELLSPDYVAQVLSKVIVKAPLSWSGKLVSVKDEELLKTLE
eukprot:gene5678-9499_t